MMRPILAFQIANRAPMERNTQRKEQPSVPRSQARATAADTSRYMLMKLVTALRDSFMASRRDSSCPAVAALDAEAAAAAAMRAAEFERPRGWMAWREKKHGCQVKKIFFALEGTEDYHVNKRFFFFCCFVFFLNSHIHIQDRPYL